MLFPVEQSPGLAITCVVHYNVHANYSETSDN